jgi:cyclic pyranopterin phosphate synthase
MDRVLEGLDAAMAEGRFRKVKVNAVAIRGFTEEELPRFCELARTTGCQVRFIEFMPLDGDRSWDPSQVLSGAELRALIAEHHELVEVEREPSATARVYRFADGVGEIGFINPVSEPFCSDCNRLRLTAEGKLRTCLFSNRETDLRDPLRSGAEDEQVEAVIRQAVLGKELRHRISESDFRQPDRTMSAIGG